MLLRKAKVEDAQELLEIYAPYVTNTAVSFEYDVPSLEEFENRISNTLKDYPYIVAEEDGKIVGYAYASRFHSRKAYEHCVETSIYVEETKHGIGIGKALYDMLEKYLKKQNVYILYACIASTDDANDEHLTNASIIFHEKMGFVMDGKHKECGFKFKKWYDVCWMSKAIGIRDDKPMDFVHFDRLLLD